MSLDPGAAFQDANCTAAQLIASYQSVRRLTEDLCAPLAVEDYVLQAMPDASPPRWPLAHVPGPLRRFF